MAEEETNSVTQKASLKKRLLKCLSVLVLAVLVLFALALTFNNISFTSKKQLSVLLDTAIKKADGWVYVHSEDILLRKNAALIYMLSQCNNIKSNKDFKKIVDSFLKAKIRHHSACWKKEIDPDWPINKNDLNRLIKEVEIDYKWILYALAPDKVKTTPEELEMFDVDKWHGRELTHQLYALVFLRKTKPSKELEEYIEHLCNRLTKELMFDLAVTDIYIQKVAFVLQAGYPEKIRQKWIERIADNQLSDGGWNDRWFCFTSGRRPVVSFDIPPSNQHATVQAVNALYFARYRYAKQLGIE